MMPGQRIKSEKAKGEEWNQSEQNYGAVRLLSLEASRKVRRLKPNRKKMESATRRDSCS